MDGASKFVRGDAIAGIIITLVNILGGIYVGMVEHGMPIMRLPRGVHQADDRRRAGAAIPAFMVSLGAGMIVTRSNAKSNLGEELVAQLTSRPIALDAGRGRSSRFWPSPACRRCPC